jgi:hypothetical protein
VQPEYGASENGYLARFHNTHTLDTGSAGGRTYGYIVWFPDYAGVIGNESTTAYTNANFVGFAANVGSSRPVNVLATPQFQSSDLAAVSGGSFSDPSFQWVLGEAVQDARCVAGCMQFMYTGTVTGAQGRVGFLEGITRESLLSGGESGQAPSVNEMFAIAADVQRLPLGKLEVKYRPSDNGRQFRAEGVSNPGESTEGGDNCIVAGIPGVNTSHMPLGGIATGAGTGIGFVWSGLPQSSDLVIEAYKAIEWRPEASAGLVMPPPRNVSSGGNIAEAVVAKLDKHRPGWTREVLDTGARALTNAVFAGVMPGPVGKLAGSVLGSLEHKAFKMLGL